MTDDAIITALINREDGYVDHPNDHGSCTNFGITRATLAAWRGHPVTCEDVRNMPESEARAIYAARYVSPFDGVDPALKPQVVDIAVNSGVSRARALLAMAHQGPKPVGVQLVVERLKHYARIVQHDPTQRVFLAGWIARACEFL